MSGSVFKVTRNGGDGTVMAAKLFKPSEWDSFHLEIEKQGSLDHPQILKLIDAYPDKVNGCVLVMELGKGQDMKSYLLETEPEQFPKERVLNWFVQMATAVNYLHTEKFFVHLDLHNKNFMVEPSTDLITLLDFTTLRDLGPNGSIPGGQRHHFPPMFASPE